MLGLGLIGVGEFGRFVSRIINSSNSFKLRAVADIDEKTAPTIATHYKVPYYRDYRKLLRQKDIDLVIINTPNDLHEKMVIDAIKSNKHIFCEKPLALSVAAIENIYEQAKRSHRLVGVDFVLRQNSFYRIIKKQLPKFGKLRSMMVNNQGTENFISTKWYWDSKRSGGWFVTANIHFYDLFFYLGGDDRKIAVRSHEFINKKNQRTTAIATQVNTATNELSIFHNFSNPWKNAATVVQLDFDKAHIEIQDWVPSMMTITTPNSKKVHTLATDRELEYHKMILGGLKTLADAIAGSLSQQQYQSSQDIKLSHFVAFQAQKNARQLEIS